MNKKYFFSFFLTLGVLCLVLVSAVVVEINPTPSKSLASGNHVCEYYQKEFSVGEKDTVTVNGATLNIEYLGNKNWEVNGYQGELLNHDFFVGNQDSRLKRVRFDFSFMDQHQPDGKRVRFNFSFMDQHQPDRNFGLTEQDYYPWDCQGYSQSTGMVSTIYVGEGWNLVPSSITLRGCHYALEGELCQDDVLVSYVYIPSLGKYMTEEEIQENQYDPMIQDYFSEENEFTFEKSSKWIYVKPGVKDKSLIGGFGAYIPYRNEYLEQGTYKLNAGWNFLFVDAFMIYDDNWEEDTLSLEDIKGDCNVEGVYLWTLGKEWMKYNEKFDDDMIGHGFIAKVENDCTLKYDIDVGGPPVLP